MKRACRLLGVAGGNERAQASLAGDLWSTFGLALIQLAVAPVLTALLARTLGVDEFGRYNFLQRISLLLMPLFTLGTTVGVTRFVAEYRGQARASEYLWISLGCASLGSLVAGSLAQLGLLDWAWDTTADHYTWWLIVILVLLPGYARILTSWLRGTGNFLISNSAALIWTIARLFVAALMWFGLDLSAVVVVLIFLIMDLGIHVAATVKAAPPRMGLTAHRYASMGDLVKYSVPRAPGGVALQLLQSFGILYFSRQGDYVSASYMAVGLTILNFGSLLFSRLGTVLLPHFSYELAQQAKATGEIPSALTRQLRIIMSFLIASAVVSGTLGMYFIPYVVTVWLGQSFQGATTTTSVLTSAVGMMALYSVVSGAINAKDIRPMNTINLLLVLGCMASGLVVMRDATVEQISSLQAAGFALLAVLTVGVASRMYEVALKQLDLRDSFIVGIINICGGLIAKHFFPDALVVAILTVCVLAVIDIYVFARLNPDWFKVIRSRVPIMRA